MDFDDAENDTAEIRAELVAQTVTNEVALTRIVFLSRVNAELRKTLVRFLIATTEDDCYVDSIIRVREEASKLLGLPKPPHFTTSTKDEKEWLRLARALTNSAGT